MDATLIAFITFVICFIAYAIYEQRNIKLLNPRVFQMGIKFVDLHEPWLSTPKVSQTLQKTPSGSFKVLSPELILFRYDLMPAFSLKFKTPFMLKGKIEIAHGEAHITGRPPLATIMFIGFWLSWWVSAGLAIIMQRSDIWLHGVLVMILGLGLAVALIGISFRVEKKRLLQVLDELKTVLVKNIA